MPDENENQIPVITDSILLSTRHSLGSERETTVFDGELIPLINTYLMMLHQVGVGVDGFAVHDETETWQDFLGEDASRFEGVKTYVFIRTKLIFDPPISTHVTKVLEDTYKELEWRLKVKSENQLE